MNLIQQLEKEQFEKLSASKDIPDFGPGDTLIVNVKVVEGDRTRVQAVAADVFRSQFLGECDGQAANAELGCTVVTEPAV